MEEYAENFNKGKRRRVNPSKLRREAGIAEVHARHVQLTIANDENNKRIF